MTQAQPSLEFIPPAYNPLVLSLAKGILPIWLRYGQNISLVEINNASELVNLYRQFQARKIRFMLAFRHPAVTDPPGLLI